MDSKNEMTSLTSETITMIKFPLAIIVVFIHCFGGRDDYSFPSDLFSLTEWDVYNLVRTFFSHVLGHFAVPTFFVISGYLFYRRLETWDWQVWKQKMLSRFHTLVIPYVVWCAIFVIWIPFLKVPVLKLGAVILKGKPLHGIIEYWETVNIDWWHVLWDSHVWGGNFMDGLVTIFHMELLLNFIRFGSFVI